MPLSYLPCSLVTASCIFITCVYTLPACNQQARTCMYQGTRLSVIRTRRLHTRKFYLRVKKQQCMSRVAHTLNVCFYSRVQCTRVSSLNRAVPYTTKIKVGESIAVNSPKYPDRLLIGTATEISNKK